MTVNRRLSRLTRVPRHRGRFGVEPMEREVQGRFENRLLPLVSHEDGGGVPNIIGWNTATANGSQFFNRGSACFEAV